jgi:hypothetical protein
MHDNGREAPEAKWKANNLELQRLDDLNPPF